ncbi:hypothetical protein BKA82DRAFT_161910 [Pisolithus tinctorius]|uniref:Uncharacterized protein n=1 Tax=Pisolithus tinctorius Marx 270 TaxID=870435 RepID=A0A0C3IIT0_PISTI|nr:hypothetical protein BKA82DRAFT_161910 [Pisolithus tinctorius]KIN96887.1 hypothetical protein M404DRAFT_161910 [Pisolithus tinctorius Marx 270]
MADPNLEECPNFKLAAFHKIHETMMATLDINLEQAIARLCTAWDNNHQCREEEAQQRENQHRQDPDPVPRPDKEGQNNKHHDTEHKKPQMADFTIGRPPPSILVNRPSQYATNKLTSCNYVKLWYFSLEGCNNVAKHARSNADDAFRISSTNDLLTLRPVASVKASQNAHAVGNDTDHNLNFSEFLQARVSFLHHIKMVPWPEKHINALTMFFWNLKSHPQCSTTNSNAIVLSYTSQVHCQWHDELKANNSHVFDISIINDMLMNSIAFEVNDVAQKRLA